MTASTPAPCTNVGFLSVHQEPSGFVGGYLVTNSWGRPLEFRLSSAVQPNRVQSILYGDTLHGYLCGEVIGKTLIDKTTTPVAWVLVDNPMTLDLRLRVETPVGLWHSIFAPDAPMPGLLVESRLYCQRDFPDDVAALRAQIEKMGQFDFGEPFARIREALTEARKMGVTRSGRVSFKEPRNAMARCLGRGTLAGTFHREIEDYLRVLRQKPREKKLKG